LPRKTDKKRLKSIILERDKLQVSLYQLFVILIFAKIHLCSPKEFVNMI